VDLGCGTGWSTARLSRLVDVKTVLGIDLSRRFLETTTRRVIGCLGGDAAKIRLHAGSFERVPAVDHSMDCAFLIAAIHHALSPRRVLLEARRVLKPTGTLVIIEATSSLWTIPRARRASIAETRASGASEIAYTLGELLYVVEWSGFVVDHVLLSPDPPSRTKLRTVVRRVLRLAGLSSVISTPTRIIVCSPLAVDR
jgi:ubiquinone/menaquinone biosynthesis C-methylase UbiE